MPNCQKRRCLSPNPSHSRKNEVEVEPDPNRNVIRNQALLPCGTNANANAIGEDSTSTFLRPPPPPPLRKRPPRRPPELLPQEIIDPITNNTYRVVSCLGSGAFGKVFLVRDTNDGGDGEGQRLKACKMQAVAAADSLGSGSGLHHSNWSLVQELAPLLMLDHQNIIKFFNYFVTSTHSFFLMEYCDLGSVQQLLSARKDTLIDPEIRFLAKPIINAVTYIHDIGLHHRDIKPGNVLLHGRTLGSPLQVKLCDFGASCMFSENGMVQGRVGSPNYVAPETLQGDKKPYHGPSADVWGLGCFLYSLVYGRPPFLARSHSEIIRRVSAGEYELPANTNTNKVIDSELKGLIRSCLSMNPKERPAAHKIRTLDYFCRSYIPKPTELGDIYTRTQDYTDRIEKYVPPPKPRPGMPVPFAETYLGKKMKLFYPDPVLHEP